MARTRNLKRRTDERLIDQLAAAKALGVDRSTVLRRVAAGELEAETVNGTPKIVRASVEAYLARQRKSAATQAA